MARVWDEAFWKPSPSPDARLATLGGAVVAPIALLAVLILAVSVAAGPIFALTVRAAEQVLQPDAYIQAVLGGR